VILVLAHSWSAFACPPIYVSLQKIDRSLLEAARDLGDSGARRLRRIVLPLAMPGLLAAFLLVFVPTMGDYITPALVGGTDGAMVGTAIASLFGKEANAPLGAALSVATMLAVALVAPRPRRRAR
jgi:spermidine/putrescine transport system permease protein